MKRINTINKIMNCGAVAVGTGSDFTKGVRTGDYELITKTASFVEEVRTARSNS